MKLKKYLFVSSFLFLVIAFVHTLRLLLQWPATINGWNLPLWLSGVIAIIGLLMAYSGSRLGKK